MCSSDLVVAETPSIEELLVFTLEPVVKLLLLDSTNPTDRLTTVVEPIVAGRLTVTFSYVAQAGMLELSAPGVSKALALQDLLDRLRLTPQRLIAFGDMPNDLAICGWPARHMRWPARIPACWPPDIRSPAPTTKQR